MNRPQRRKQANQVTSPAIKEMSVTEKVLRNAGVWEAYKKQYEKVFLNKVI